MLVPDVNVFLNVINRASEQHLAAREWLESAGNGREPVGVPQVVLSGVVRIATGSGMRESRRTPAEAFAFCDNIHQMPAYFPLQPGPGHWEHFRQVVFAVGVTGADVSDAYLAAFAIEHDATFVSFDRGFARFPGLKLFVPGAA